MSEARSIHRENYRQYCLSLYGHKCYICETKENIVVHHIDGDRSNNTIANLIPVCESCHRYIHSPKKQSGELGKYQSLCTETAGRFRKEAKGVVFDTEKGKWREEWDE